jgi:formate hydrogenlyase subunit 3/multisubunit Na+/H+ antiporter MnhD subunit
VVLTLLAFVIAALAGLAVFMAAAPAALLRAGTQVCAALCGIGAVLALLLPLGGAEQDVLPLPFGLPGAAMHLALDPLASGFLSLAFIAGVPCAIFTQPSRDTRAPLIVLPACLAALALVLLGGDAVTLLLGLLLLGVFGWALGAPASLFLFGTAIGVVCLAAAFAVGFPGGEFAALRALPPEGGRADLVFGLAVIGAGVPLLLVPLTIWLGRTVEHAPVLSAVALPAAGFYVLLRVLFDLCGPVQPLWWGAPLLVIGAAAAIIGAVCAASAAEFDTVVISGGLQQSGLALLGLGVALGARAADQPALASMALSATWLLLVSQVLGRTLLLICAAATREGAGSRRLDRLGGLLHRMSGTAIGLLATLFSVVALPPGIGFAGIWLLFQALLGAARIGGMSLQALLIVVVAASALSGAISVMAAVRLFGVAFLGRPRTPRAAVADDIAPVQRKWLFAAAALVALLGLLPGLALVPVSQALAPLANAGLPPPDLLLALTTGVELPGYAPIPIAALLALVGGGAWWLIRRRTVTGERREAAWSGGFAPPPAWLPFGDPITQYNASSFAAPLQRALELGAATPRLDTLRTALVEHWRSLTGWLVVVACVLALWLIAT